MLVREGADRTIAADLRLACCLAAIAGGLNASAFHAVGFFAANMTGNVSALSDHLAFGAAGAGAFLVGVLLLFIAGACCATVIVSAGRRRGRRGIFAAVVILEAVLLALLGSFEAYGSESVRRPFLILGLSFAMGLQNAVVTRISDARVRTTHVSGMVTDVGIGLGHLLDAMVTRQPVNFGSAVLHRLGLHAATIASFLAGGVVGVFGYRVSGSDAVLFGASALLSCIGSFGLAKSVRRNHASVSFRGE